MTLLRIPPQVFNTSRGSKSNVQIEAGGFYLKFYSIWMGEISHLNIHCVSIKKQSKLFLSQRCQIFIKFDNFGTAMAKMIQLHKVYLYSTSSNL